MNKHDDQGQSSLPSSDVPVKRKRGRPRKDENIIHSESITAATRTDTVMNPKESLGTSDLLDNMMVGQVVSGVIEAAFDAGYLLNVRVGDSDTHLKGVVFLPERVAPITAENDVAPNVKMVKRREIPIPSLNQQAQALRNTPSSSVHTTKPPIVRAIAPVPNQDSGVSVPLNKPSVPFKGNMPTMPKDFSVAVGGGVLQESPIATQDRQSAFVKYQPGYDNCEALAESQGIKSNLEAINDSETTSPVGDIIPGIGTSSGDIVCEHQPLSLVSNEKGEESLSSGEFKTVSSEQISKQVEDGSINLVSVESGKIQEKNAKFPMSSGQKQVSPGLKAMSSELISKSLSNPAENHDSLEAHTPEVKTPNLPIETIVEIHNFQAEGKKLFDAAANISETKKNPASGIFQHLTLFPSEAVPSKLKPAGDASACLGMSEESGKPPDTNTKFQPETIDGLDASHLDRRPAVDVTNIFQVAVSPALEALQHMSSSMGSVVQSHSMSVTADGSEPVNIEFKDGIIPSAISFINSNMHEHVPPNNS